MKAINQNRSSGLLRPAMAFVVLATVGTFAGCGQTLSLRVERIATVADDQIPDFARSSPEADTLVAARLVLAELADQVAVTAGRVQRFFAAGALDDIRNAVTDSTKWRDELTSVDASFDAPKLRLIGASLKGRLTFLRNFAASSSTHKSLQIGDENSNQLVAMVPQMDQLIRHSEAALNAMNKRLDRMIFGGYRSESIYVLNPGSKAYVDLVANNSGSRPKLIFSQVEAVAVGDSTLLAVQESPAHFTMRYVSGDPTQAIRNALIATNRIMTVAAAFVPALSGVGAALGSASTGDESTGADAPATEESSTVGEAEEAIDAFDDALRALMADAELVSLLDKVRSSSEPAHAISSLTDAERSKLFEKIIALRTALGG